MLCNCLPAAARSILSAALFALCLAGFGQSTPALLQGMHWRMVGPFRGGRALAVSGVPGSPEKFYFGAVGGGVWKTENAGRTWVPIFDKEPDASIGAIAAAPSDPNVIYVGAGEADMRNDIQQGHGMYRSDDAGATWKHIGLEDSRQIGKILVDPGDPDIVYVAALGHQYGPNEQRGVFKSTDGGKTWSKVLYENPDTGAIDLAMDPNDSNVIFASMWQTRRPPWSFYPPSNGPGSGLYKSTDAGATWTQVRGGGFPSFVGRVGVTISPADSNRVYACVDTNDAKNGGVYRSDDGGATWRFTDGDQRIWTRGWYFCGITADPKDPDTVYVMNTSGYRSTDGGKNFTAFKGAPGGDDYHTCWIYPDDPKRMILGSDQGVVISVDGGSTWSSWYNQPTAQLFHVVTDNRDPYWIYGAQQDSGAIAVPSRTIHTGVSALYQRPIDAGGESGTISPDPLHPGLLHSNGGGAEQIETGWQLRNDPTAGLIDSNWRSEWTQPIARSPVDPRVLYTSHQRIFRSSDDGASWKVISPDLTRPTTTVPPLLDKATAYDNDGEPRRGVVYWIAPSPLFAHEVWASTDDGLIWFTSDDSYWINVTPRGLTPWSKVAMIDASHYDAGTAYAVVDRHRIDDDHPYIYRTHDFGQHWTLVTNGIPAGQFVNVVREDPKRRGLLYAGTDWGVYYSLDDGNHWMSLQLNLPAASMRDIVFGGNDVVLGTHGRSIWILDDPTPLRQAAGSSLVMTLFKPSTAVPFQRAGTFGFGAFDEGTPLPPEEPQGENAPWGAVLDYSLARDAASVRLEILERGGKLVRAYSSAERPRPIDTSRMDIPAYWVHPGQALSDRAGGHRFLWDLRYGNGGPIAPPGAYIVRLTVDGRAYSKPLTVARDPRVAATDADLRTQYRFALSIGDEIQVVHALRERAQRLLPSTTNPARRRWLETLLGDGQPRRRRRAGSTPDEGDPAPTDFGSIGRIDGALNGLRGDVESAPSAPTSGAIAVFKTLKARVAAISRKLKTGRP